MRLLQQLIKKTEKCDFLFPNNFNELMNDEYYDYDKFEWFLYYVFKFEGCEVEKIGKKGKGDGGVDIILNISEENETMRRIGVQAKYWKNRVGVQPVNQLASAKTMHHLTDLWIITTSDLTNAAKEITEKIKIKVLRKDDVIQLIEAIKKKHKEQIEKNGQSSIEFLQPKIEESKQDILKLSTEAIEYVELLKKFRFELSKKYKLYPVYKVFNNKMIQEIIAMKPTSIDELARINGFGPKKVEQFGLDLVSFINDNLVDKKPNDIDLELYELLILEREKIAKYNNLIEDEVYTDDVVLYLVKMKPQDIDTLDQIYGFRKENLKIFGDYLTKVIKRFVTKK